MDALARQSYPAGKLQIIVVDNGSAQPVSDASFASLVSRPIEIVHESAPGSYSARNRGIRLAKGTILAFTDSDCIPDVEWVECGVSRLSLEGPGTILGGAIEVFAKDTTHPTMAEAYEIAVAFPQEASIRDRGFSTTANLFVWRETLAAVGPFSTAAYSGGDVTWCRKALSDGYRLVFEPSAIVRHPARGSIVHLVRKSLRLIGAQHDRGGYRLWSLFNVVSSFREFRLILKSPRLARSEKLGASLVAIVMKCARLVIRLLFKCGLAIRWR